MAKSPNAASRIAARVSAIVADAPDETPTAASASDPNAGAPPSGSGSEAESTAGAGAQNGATSPTGAGQPTTLQATGEPGGEGDTAARMQKTKHQIQEEKLRELRERNAARRESEGARRAREAAEADRKAASDERTKLNDALKKGTFKETLEALGRDPRQAFEEMAAEAREAGKPETIIARMRGDFERQMAEVVEPLKKRLEEAERTNAERDAHLFESQFAHDLSGAIDDPKFEPLLVEYEPTTLLQIARSLRENPQNLFAHARRLNVQLTAPPGRFNMKDICNVMHAQHVDHEAGKEQRRARLQAAKSSSGAPQQAPAKAPTVNGTAEKRNAAGNPLGNDLATSRATEAQKPRESRRARVDRLIRDG